MHILLKIAARENLLKMGRADKVLNIAVVFMH